MTRFNRFYCWTQLPSWSSSFWWARGPLLPSRSAASSLASGWCWRCARWCHRARDGRRGSCWLRSCWVWAGLESRSRLAFEDDGLCRHCRKCESSARTPFFVDRALKGAGRDPWLREPNVASIGLWRSSEDAFIEFLCWEGTSFENFLALILFPASAICDCNFCPQCSHAKAF